jgi:hypothetical protein
MFITTLLDDEDLKVFIWVFHFITAMSDDDEASHDSSLHLPGHLKIIPVRPLNFKPSDLKVIADIMIILSTPLIRMIHNSFGKHLKLNLLL